MSLFEFFLNSIPEIDAFIDKSLNNLKIDLESVEESYTENIESFESHGKKYLVRNIISNSRCLLEHIKKGEVYGFGFFGIRNTPLERCDYLMSTDQSICDQFSQYPDIFAYLSYKREDHHDWGNIVFIKNEDVISHFMSSSRHAETTASKGAIWFGGVCKPHFSTKFDQTNERWKVSWKSVLIIDIPNKIRERRSLIDYSHQDETQNR